MAGPIIVMNQKELFLVLENLYFKVKQNLTGKYWVKLS